MNAYYASGQSFVFVINYNKSEGICILNKDLPSNLLDYSFKHASSSESLSHPVRFDFDCIPFPLYETKFNKILDQIRQGNSYLCNLTQPTNIKINLNLEEIYTYSKAPFKLFLKDLFVVFSPEAFVNIHDGQISTYPMKGTISAEPEENKDILMNDPKEDAEHNTIVDLLRNDLSIVASHVRVNKFKFIQKIDTNRGPIWQMSSEISGNIKPEFRNNPGDLFDKILPAGSVTGAPKEKTVAILKDIEDYDRGYYTGIFGYCDGKNIESAVMIRFIEQTEDGLVYKSGGGITSLSLAVKEYQELIQKVYVPVF